jgi:hypothetical protein
MPAPVKQLACLFYGIYPHGLRLSLRAEWEKKNIGHEDKLLSAVTRPVALNYAPTKTTTRSTSRMSSDGMFICLLFHAAVQAGDGSVMSACASSMRPDDLRAIAYDFFTSFLRLLYAWTV